MLLVYAVVCLIPVPIRIASFLGRGRVQFSDADTSSTVPQGNLYNRWTSSTGMWERELDYSTGVSGGGAGSTISSFVKTS